MRSVLDGGDGVIRGGREDRSREWGVWVPFDRGEGDGEGEEMGGEMAAIFLCRWDVLIVVQCEYVGVVLEIGAEGCRALCRP